MNKNLKNVLIIIFFLIILGFILLNSNLMINKILEIANIWIKKIFPSLLPFFIIGDILINYNFIYYLAYFFNPIIKLLFNTSPNISFVFILSMISGFPSNAKYTKDLYQNNYLSLEEAEMALGYTFFSNPIFIITMTNLIFNNTKITLTIILSHYLSNIFIGIIFRFKMTKNNNNSIKKQISIPFNTLLSNSIVKSINTLLLILGTIIFFIIISTFINNIFNLPIVIKTLVGGLLEITQGINSLNILNISTTLKTYFVVIFLSFGGLSVHLQIKSILEDTPISLKPFYIGRILHVIISIILITIIN